MPRKFIERKKQNKMTQQLKMETKNVHIVEYGDLEDFIQRTTGHEYEIISSEEMSNDSSKTYSVKKFDNSEYTVKYKVPEWEQFKSTGKNQGWCLGLILDGLASDGHIPEGEYVIEISW